MCPKTIIEGITPDGEKFRPSDWAERFSSEMQTINHQRRLKYSPLLRPSYNEKGNKCILIDNSLKESNPELWQHIIDFAQKNQLNICHDEDDTSD